MHFFLVAMADRCNSKLAFPLLRTNVKKISICLNRGREESVGNDDVSIVCARKYEMVQGMT